MENIFVEFLPPWVETGLQPAFYDKESGTALQQTARMYARVNMLIRMFNKLSKNTKTTVEDYINQFNELHDYVHDYFDNLDVQEEINNKLDKMLEDGVLQEIITTYIQSNVAWMFDTVADMKAATNLVDGSYARTLGYHEKNDGGGSYYKISSSQPDSYYETLNSSLYAELITGSAVNPEMFGAYCDSDFHGTGGHDDTVALQNAINTGKNVISYKKGFYKTTDSLIIKSFMNRTLELHAGIRCEGNEKFAIVFDGSGYVGECNIILDDIVAYGGIAFYPQNRGSGAVAGMKLSARIMYTTAECIYVENDGWFNENIFRDINFQHGSYAFKCIFKGDSNAQKDFSRLTFEHCHFEGVTNGVKIDVNGNNNIISGLVFDDCRMVESISGVYCDVTTAETTREYPSLSAVLIKNNVLGSAYQKFVGNVLYIIPVGYFTDGNPQYRSKGQNQCVFYGNSGIPLIVPICDPTSSVSVSDDPNNRTSITATSVRIPRLAPNQSGTTNYIDLTPIQLPFYYFVCYQISGFRGTYDINVLCKNNTVHITINLDNDKEIKLLYIDYYRDKVFIV